MDSLRTPNSRPSVVIDPAAFGVADPARSFVGRPKPLGRERLLYALALDPGPALLRPPTVVRDPSVAQIGDISNDLIGREAVWVSRMLTVAPTEDTRGLGGGGAA